MDKLNLTDDKGQTLPFRVLNRAIVEAAVRRHEGNVSEAARALRVGRSTLYRWFTDWGVDPTDLI